MKNIPIQCKSYNLLLLISSDIKINFPSFFNVHQQSSVTSQALFSYIEQSLVLFPTIEVAPGLQVCGHISGRRLK